MTTLLIVLVVLWALGYGGGFMLGGFIHLLLVIAVIVFLFDYVQGRRP